MMELILLSVVQLFVIDCVFGTSLSPFLHVPFPLLFNSAVHSYQGKWVEGMLFHPYLGMRLALAKYMLAGIKQAKLWK